MMKQKLLKLGLFVFVWMFYSLFRTIHRPRSFAALVHLLGKQRE